MSYKKINDEHDAMLLQVVQKKLMNFVDKFEQLTESKSELETIRIEMLRFQEHVFEQFKRNDDDQDNGSGITFTLSKLGISLLFDGFLVSVSDKTLCFAKKGDSRKFSHLGLMKHEETRLTHAYMLDVLAELKKRLGNVIRITDSGLVNYDIRQLELICKQARNDYSLGKYTYLIDSFFESEFSVCLQRSATVGTEVASDSRM